MESKKINQLATELAPELSDLTIIGDPTTGISKKITLSQMASLFTGTVEEYASLSAFPLVGAADTIYIALDTNIIYRWNTGTNAYVELSPNIVTSLVFNDANGFDGTISLVGSTATLTITTALTTGSVGFIGSSGALTQDNANFFWDNSNKRLGINTNAPTTALDVFGSGIIGRVNGTSTNNAFLGFASAGTNKWSIGNVQSDHRFRIYNEATTSELVSVLQTGEFGIGIANPTTKLHIDGGASALIANLDANISVAKSISFRSDNSARINLEVSGTESGSNAGANFYLRTYTDAGSLLATPLTIIRSTGAATFSNTVTASNGTLIGGSGTTNYIPRFSASTALVDSAISDDSSLVTIARQTKISNNLKIYGETYTSIELQDGGTGDPGYIYINNYGTRVASIGAGDTYFNTGKVGIGTSTPNTILEVKGGTSMTTLANSYTNAGIIHQYNSTNILAFGSNGTSMIIQGVNAGTNGAVQLLLQPFAGQVLIGATTANSSRKLEVNGYVRSNGLDISIGTTTSGYILPQGEWLGVTNSNLAIVAESGNAITFYTNGSGTQKMQLTTSGQLWVNVTSNPAGSIMALSNSGVTIYGTTGQYRQLNQSGATLGFFNGSNEATLTSAGVWTNASDISIKKDIKEIKYGLNEVLKLKPKWYKMIEDDTEQIGFIAQDVEQILPELVSTSERGMKGLSYGQLTAVLVKAIQELNSIIK